jgi:hypothetical protein
VGVRRGRRDTVDLELLVHVSKHGFLLATWGVYDFASSISGAAINRFLSWCGTKFKGGLGEGDQREAAR